MLVFGTSPLQEPECVKNAAQGLKISDTFVFFSLNTANSNIYNRKQPFMFAPGAPQVVCGGDTVLNKFSDFCFPPAHKKK